MLHKCIRIPRDNAVEIMNELGKIDEGIEFLDLTKDDLEAKRNFALMIKRCDEMEKRIKYITLVKFSSFMRLCDDYNINLAKFRNYAQFVHMLTEDEKTRNSRRLGVYFDVVESDILEDDRKITELIDSYSQIKENLESLVERKHVYHKAGQLISSDEIGKSFHASFLESGQISKLSFIAGVVKADDVMRMRRMIFRVSSGRALTTFWDFDNETILKTVLSSIKKGDTSHIKKIFTIFYQHEENSSYLEGKIIKICDLFNTSRYTIPSHEQLGSAIHSLEDDIKQKKSFLDQAENSIKDFLYEKGGYDNMPGKYMMYKLYFKKEKVIYMNLNKCLVRDNFIDGEIWIPEKKYELIRGVLSHIKKDDETKLTANLTDAHYPTTLAPPTYIETNDFLWPFQEIVNTYGIPRYREINPAYFNIVTFPFLFGVMFGDIGHGFILFLFGLYLCIWKESIEKDSTSMIKPALKARYLLLMMGFFAVYSGLMYNDFFSLPIGIFGSCYNNVGEVAKKSSKSCIYPFGLDPKWYSASNELSFFNSMKMKLSVIFGVLHMLFGIILRGCNSAHFGLTADLIFQFIPQFIFMSILFGYMDVMIILKWTTDWSGREKDAPSLITQLMNIFLSLGSVV